MLVRRPNLPLLVVLCWVLMVVGLVRARPYADPFTAGTILDVWGGSLGPDSPNAASYGGERRGTAGRSGHVSRSKHHVLASWMPKIRR